MTAQALRFLIVGGVNNLILYLAYLLFTRLGLDHKIAMTVVYIAGVLLGFMINRSWTFRHDGHVATSFIRYCLAYLLGYLLNLLGLYWLVDIAQLPHQAVQLCIMLLLAVMFFVLQRYWIFNNNNKRPTGRVTE